LIEGTRAPPARQGDRTQFFCRYLTPVNLKERFPQLKVERVDTYARSPRTHTARNFGELIAASANFGARYASLRAILRGTPARIQTLVKRGRERKAVPQRITTKHHVHGGFPDVEKTIAYNRAERIDAVVRYGANATAIKPKFRFK
jgi:hypothetical protein